ncbi:Coenzyme F420 hydrogenase/dehydrogenase, beta subunit C-terminal domain [Clostridium tagluense]|uniref:Coenzyme F420 hydrogenase/dehydrogenase, beta subunit C-terminal domain n=1 Tax=Clostridium tagluense TaxID=360422 RepID=UPI001CF534DA|nr:Coenzyme F420 hydrogenase/dehydrogenase, beta subunit C-terminal domain [Clostridium tagluense]MCB2298254.1 Coenzyme F420 hydrogenase/dehydrogenase, beta subunit C-terminal domain [Clostridium tagluense]
MKNILKSTEDSCTGCSLCSLICPQKAISISLTTKGFYEPKVDENKCTSCGLCRKVCYKFITPENEYDIEKAIPFLVYSKDKDIRKKSSSGGAGREIANYGLLNDYLVCGVKYNYELDRAEHVIIDRQEELDLITGSKYIQSLTIGAFDEIDNKKKYVIFGTPCQMYGLRKYIQLNGIEDNFILVDFFCHGVPSYKLWDKYLVYLKDEYKISNITSLNFRDKTYGWHDFSMKISGDNNYTKTLNEDLYLKFFLSNLCLNESCYNCKLRFNKIYSDIRLGDFWGPMRSADEKGSSIVLSNTDKGFKLLESIKEKIHLEEVSFEELKISQYAQCIHKPELFDRFNADLEMDYSLKKLHFRYMVKPEFIQKSKSIPKRVVRKLLPKKIKKYIKEKFKSED